MKYKTHKEFFDKFGDHTIDPEYYGKRFWSVTVEEMYQHFKARFRDESQEPKSE